MANTLDPIAWAQQQTQSGAGPTGPQGVPDPQSWLQGKSQDNQPTQQQQLPFGATTKLPGSQALSPGQDTTGQGEAYYGAIGPDGKPTGKIGGMGLSAISSQWDDYIKRKQSEFYAPVYTQQADGTYKLENPSLGQYAGRLAANALGTLGDAFSLGGNAIAGVFSLSRGEEDLADMAKSPLPDVFKQDTAVNFFLQPALNVYNALRIATGTQKLTPDTVLKTLDASVQGASVAYTSVKDPLVRQEFEKRYLAGENPQYLAAQLANPFAEMIGRIVFDPLNVIGVVEKAGADAVKMASYQKEFASLAEGLDGLKAIDPNLEQGVFAGLNAMDRATQAKVIPQIAEKITGTTAGVLEDLKNFGNKGPEFFQYTSTARREFATEKVNSVFQALMSVTKSDPDSAASALKAFALIGSGDASKTEEALQIIKGLPFDISNVALSKGGIESGSLLHSIMTDSKGVFNPESILEELKTAKQSGSYDALMSSFTDKIDKAAANLYPTVSEQIAKIQKDAAKLTKAGDAEAAATKLAEIENIPAHVRAINDWNERAQKILQPVNKFFSSMYIVANPGSGVRNLLGNLANTFADLGPGAVLDTLGNIPAAAQQVAGVAVRLPSDIWTEKMLGGVLPQGAVEEIGAVAGELGQKGAKSGVWNTMVAARQATERVSSSAIVARSVENNMRNVLKPGLLLPTAEELSALGLNSAAQDRYYQIAKSITFGDHEATMALLRPEIGAGTVESWRNIHSWMTPGDISKFREANILPAIEDAANSSKTVEEAMAKADAIVEKQMKAAAGMLKAAPPVPTGDSLAGLESIGENKLTEWAIQRQAENNMRQASYDAAFGLINDTSPASVPLRDELHAWMTTKGGEVKQQSDALVATANQAMTLIKNGDSEGAIALMKNSALSKDLQIPAGTSGQALRDLIWNFTKPEQNRLWTEFNVGTHDMALNLAQKYAEANGQDINQILQGDTWMRAEKAYQDAMSTKLATYIPDKGLFVDQQSKKIAYYLSAGNEKDATRALFSQYGIREEHGDNALINIINAHSGKSYDLHAIENNEPGIFADAKSALEDRMKTAQEKVLESADRRAAIERRTADIPAEGQTPRSGQDRRVVGERRQTSSYTNSEIATLNPKVTGATPEQVAAAQQEELNRLKGFSPDAMRQKARESSLQNFNKNIEGLQYAFNTSRRRAVDSLTMSEADNPILQEINRLKNSSPIPMPVDPQNLPIDNLHAYNASESLPGVTDAVGRFKNQLSNMWGKGEPVTRLAPEAEQASAQLAAKYNSRLFEARTVIGHAANEARDFALYNYSKRTYADLALGYVSPYSFWYTRTYGTWMQRLARNPEIIAGYAKYRQAMQTAHANLPDWWKYNINSNELLGMHSDHPLFFNLEASLNPLNGVTGVDFTDPKKVVGEPGSAMRMWTQGLDDVSKFGPAPHTLLTAATAVGLYMAGEKDAAPRWMPRLIPQTATIKAISSEFGQPLELDPATNILGGGHTPYEASQIGRAMGAFIQNGQLPDGTPLTQAQAEEAMHTGSGPAYDAAYRTAIQDRAPYQMLSFIGGSGFTMRTPQDLQVDQFYNDYNQFWSNSANLSPQEFSVGMQQLQQKYPFMDSVLLAKKDGLDRDRGYAYNVMNRIAPGQTTAVGKQVGLDPRLLDKFYTDKGDTSKWSPSDRNIFFSKIVDIGAILDVPPNSVKQEWIAAKNEYTSMNDAAQKQFGSDILVKAQAYFDAAKENKAQYLLSNPEVQQYLDWKAQYVVNNPLLSTYYNGLGQLRQYYDGKMRTEATTTLGNDIFNTVTSYSQIKQNGTSAQATAFYRAHPEIKKFYAILDKWDMFANRKIVEAGNYFPEGQKMAIRPDANPQSTGQTDLYNAQTNPQPSGPQWSQIAPSISTDLHDSLVRYIQSGTPLTYSARTRLTVIAKQLNMSLDDLIVLAGNSLQPQQ